MGFWKYPRSLALKKSCGPVMQKILSRGWCGLHCHLLTKTSDFFILNPMDSEPQGACIDISKEVLEGSRSPLSEAIKTNPRLFNIIRHYFHPLKAREIVYTDLERFEHGCVRRHEGMTVSLKRLSVIDSDLSCKAFDFSLRYHFCHDCKRLFLYLP